MHLDSVESAGGRLGAVLSAPRSGAAWPSAATVPGWSRPRRWPAEVLTEPGRFDFPGDVSRSGDLSSSRGETRSGHVLFAPLTPDEVARGVDVFASEWDAALRDHDSRAPGTAYDAMLLLRQPVARSTVAAVLDTDVGTRDRVADLTLGWIDALAPGHLRPPAAGTLEPCPPSPSGTRASPSTTPCPPSPGSRRLPSRWPRCSPLASRCRSRRARGCSPGSPPHTSDSVDPVHAVWETLRLTPPTWITARITTEPVDLGGTEVPAGRVVLVSPLLLGRLTELVPGDPELVAGFDPARWEDTTQRPGAWLPFGAGPHACPGRTLGMAQLVHLATWAGQHRLRLSEQVGIDQSRGIAPLPCRFTIDAWRGHA